MTNSPYSVLIIGLDGATFDLMLPWIESGDLPNLASLVEGGTRGCLQSTMPPITPCAWSSFMTGKNPGKHGLLDFVEPIEDSFRLRFTNAGSRKGETIWSYVGRLGRRVGAVNVPMTYPPEAVNGYMISGLDTPHEGSPYMHPAEIRGELKQHGIRYRIDQQHLGNMRTDRRRAKQLQSIFTAESARTDTFRHLQVKFNADLRMIVYGATDQVQHHFWHYMDEHHDKFDRRGADRFEHAIRDTYRHVDQQIGKLLADCDDKTVVAIMSDHGFGPTTNVRLRLNQILEDAGLLTYVPPKPGSRAKQLMAGLADRFLRGTLSPDMKRTLSGLLPQLRVWFENLDSAEIDWSKTLAYANETYRSSPAIWINRAIGLSDARIEEVKQQITRLLLDLRDPKTGDPVVSQVVQPTQLYEGEFAVAGPDLLPSWWLDGFLIEDSAPGGPVGSQVERSQEPILGGVEFAGSHRMDGVLILSGGPVRKGQTIQGANIVDVAPTVLHLMGLPIPSDMDGKVLTESLEDDFMTTHPIEHSAVETQISDSDNQDNFTDEEQELIARRLESLGYISR